MGSNLLRPFVSVFAGAAIDPELRDHRPVDHIPAPNSRRGFWAILRKCLLFTGSLHLAESNAICLISSGTENWFLFLDEVVVALISAAAFTSLSCRRTSPSPSSDSHGAASSLSLRVQSLELDRPPFGHGRPPCPTLDALLCSDFSPFHSGDHRKTVPSADPHLVQIQGHRAQVLWAHDIVKLLLTTP